MIKIAICDTSEVHRRLIWNFCNKYLDNRCIKHKIQEYASGEALLAEPFPDVLFLDTDIKNIDGILVKEILYAMKSNTIIVFVSNETEKMAKAFGKNVIAFLPKNVEYVDFEKYMISIVRDVSDQKNIIFCKNQTSIEKIYLRDVVYVKAYGRYTKLFLCGEKNYRISDKSFGEWYLDAEDTEFVSCHRSYLVNLYYIKNVKKEIELVSGERIPIGEKKREEFFESYQAYIKKLEL